VRTCRPRKRPRARPKTSTGTCALPPRAAGTSARDGSRTAGRSRLSARSSCCRSISTACSMRSSRPSRARIARAGSRRRPRASSSARSTGAVRFTATCGTSVPAHSRTMTGHEAPAPASSPRRRSIPCSRDSRRRTRRATSRCSPSSACWHRMASRPRWSAPGSNGTRPTAGPRCSGLPSRASTGTATAGSRAASRTAGSARTSPALSRPAGWWRNTTSAATLPRAAANTRCRTDSAGPTACCGACWRSIRRPARARC
jgi:hypothetical protein